MTDSRRINVRHRTGHRKYLLLGAMPQEIDAFMELEAVLREECPDREIIIELAGISKPIAAANTQRYICEHKPDAIIFTGVGGALRSDLEIGDVLIGRYAIDADLDVRVWDRTYMRGEVPFTKERVYESDGLLVHEAESAALSIGLRLQWAYIASGSAFIDAGGKKGLDLASLEASFVNESRVVHPNRPDLYDMESSAVLQVANMNDVPALVIRAVSDTLDGDAPKDFNAFVEQAVDCYVPLVEHIIRNH